MYMPIYLHRVCHLYSAHPLNWGSALDQWNTPQKILGRAVEPLHYEEDEVHTRYHVARDKIEHDLTINANTRKISSIFQTLALKEFVVAQIA